MIYKAIRNTSTQEKVQQASATRNNTFDLRPNQNAKAWTTCTNQGTAMTNTMKLTTRVQIPYVHLFRSSTKPLTVIMGKLDKLYARTHPTSSPSSVVWNRIRSRLEPTANKAIAISNKPAKKHRSNTGLRNCLIVVVVVLLPKPRNRMAWARLSWLITATVSAVTDAAVASILCDSMVR
jgi:hypothetical protein